MIRRRAAAILAGSSLLLCGFACAMWARSYFVRDTLGWGLAGGNCHLAQSILGRVHVLSSLDGGCEGGITHASDRLAKNALWQGGMSHYPQAIRWRLGCVYETYSVYHLDWDGPPGFSTNHRLIVVPYAYLAALLAAPPAIALWRWRRRARHARLGLCGTCGYDLRASAGRCPECGTAITATTTTTTTPA